MPLTVIKSHGGHEGFDRRKLVGGLSAATKGRNVTAEQLECIATEIEDALRLRGSTVTSAEIGVAVLDRLRIVDEVAYLRFASVYKGFDGASDFHRELELLEKSSTPS